MRDDLTLSMRIGRQAKRTSIVAPYILLVCVLAACSKKSEPTSASSVPPLPTRDVGNVTSPETASSTDSSLAVKRGLITMTAQTRSFRPCGATVDLTLTDQLDGGLDRTYADLGGKTIYAEVYGERGSVGANGTAANSFNVEELLYATANNASSACAAAAGNYELLAAGKDPAWSVEVHQDNMIFRQGQTTEIKFAAVDTADTEGTVTYRAGMDKHVLELVVTQRACRGADGDYFAYTATAKLDKQSFNGCARVGE